MRKIIYFASFIVKCLYKKYLLSNYILYIYFTDKYKFRIIIDSNIYDDDMYKYDICIL